MIDTHAHLTSDKFDADRTRLVASFENAGLKAVVTIGTNLEDSMECIRLCQDHPHLFPTAGIHPHDACKWRPNSAGHLVNLAADAVAIGEIGLDYYYDFSTPDQQHTALREQLAVAGDLHKPLIFHCRDAYEDLLEALDKSPYPAHMGVVHCFTGTAEQAEEFLRRGLFLSFNGMLTFKNTQSIRDLFVRCPVDRILLETDCPYLAPVPYRGRRNDPTRIGHIYDAAAQLLSIRRSDMIRLNRTNTHRLLGIGPGYNPGSIAYTYRDSVYVNITNRCTNRCRFCLRTDSPFFFGYHLVLEDEPNTAAVVKAAMELHDDTRRELVFCGFGDPIVRWDTVVEAASALRSTFHRIRVNTNGQVPPGADCRTVAARMASCVDHVSVSLGNSTPEGYNAVCRPTDQGGTDGYQRSREFIAACRAEQGLSLSLTCVDFPGVDLTGCRDYAARLNLPFRIRTFYSGTQLQAAGSGAHPGVDPVIV